VLPIIGQFERAVEESTEGIRLRPDYPFPYGFRIRAYTALNRFDEAKATYAQALERKLHAPFIDFDMYELAFAQNDTAGWPNRLQSWRPCRGGDRMLFLEGDTAAYSGNLKDRREFSRRAMDSAQRAGEKDALALYSGTSGLREVLFGNPEEARQRATLALKLSTAATCCILLRSRWRIPEMTRRRKRWPTIWARDSGRHPCAIQLSAEPPRESLRSTKEMLLTRLRVLRPPHRMSLGRREPLIWIGTRCFQSLCVAKAYLAARQGSEAAAEFQKILDHRGLVLNRPIGALAHLGLGRAYVLQGDTVKAKAAYQDFLTLWKDADPDIPVLRQAQAEYTKLH